MLFYANHTQIVLVKKQPICTKRVKSLQALSSVYLRWVSIICPGALDTPVGGIYGLTVGYSNAGNTVNAEPLLSQEIHRQFLQVPGQSTFDQPITYIISCVLLAKVALL